MAAVTCGQAEPPSKVRRTGEAAGREAADEVHGICLNSLPDELMINIFSFLSFNDLIDTVQNVCIQWKRLAHDQALWLDKEYIVDKRNSPLQGRSCCGVDISQCRHCRSTWRTSEVLRDADQMPQLRALTLRGNPRDTALRKICENCPHLTNLKIHRDLNYPLLKFIFEKCLKIQKLKLTKDLLAKRRCAELVSHLEHLKRLEIFAEYTPFFDEPGVPMRVLADGCPRLEEINFDMCSYPLADLDHFFKAKKHSITSATVPWTMGPWNGRMLVVPLLKQCDATLRKLQLCYFDVPSALTAAAFEALGELHNLHELFIKEDKSRQPKNLYELFIKEKKTRQTDNISLVFRAKEHVTVDMYDQIISFMRSDGLSEGQKSKDISTFFSRLPSSKLRKYILKVAVVIISWRPGCLTQLRRLHVANFRFFEDETLLAISRNCANLRELRIDNVLITDEGLSEIHRLKHLEILEVSGCRGLGGSAVAHVAQLPALHTLVLRNFGTLRRLMPGLQFIADMTELRCLDLLGNYGVKCVPFTEFPHMLTKLRELHVPWVPWEVHFKNNSLAELQNKMPHLKIFMISMWQKMIL